jgi:starch synthase
MRYDHIWGLHIAYFDLWVPWYNYYIRCTVWFGFVHGRKCYFIEPHSPDRFFNRGAYYGFPDEHMRFAFFTKAALEFMLKSGKRPDVIHTHDWQTALLPVLLYEICAHHGMAGQRVCHTIHNFRHQGIAGANVLWATGLGRPERYYAKDRLGDDFNPSAINFTKGAIAYSNFISTVSPTHAGEVCSSDQAFGLSHVIRLHRGKFGGILNGLDYDMWNPETDRLIAANYTVDDVDRKFISKRALRRRLLLADSFKPIVASVGRLDSQKGVNLIRHALFYSIWHGGQFVLLGSSPERGINDYFWHLKRHLNDDPDCHLEIGYDEELAHLVYTGADMVVVPSLFEPCGLSQLIAMRYGTVPVVRKVGGLADTVFDREYSDRSSAERNGFVFEHPDYGGLESAMVRAFGLWNHYPEKFRELMINGMRADYSWSRPGQDYVNVYDYIRHK